MPVLPSALFLWFAVAVYNFGINPGQLGAFFWIALVVMTVFLLLSDLIANKHFLERFDSSQMSARVGPVAIIVGAFVIPPFGLILVPFAVVLLTELLHKKPPAEALKIAAITVVSFLASTLAKGLVITAFIVLFALSIIF